MKTSPSAAADTHLNSQVISMAVLIRMQQARIGGITVGLTTHDKKLSFDDGDGAIVYLAFPGASASAVASTSAPSVDNLDMGTFFDAAGIEQADIENGLWDGTRIKLYLVNYEDLSEGAWKIRRGKFGELSSGRSLVAELRGMFQAFITEMVELTAPTCRAVFGDGNLPNPRCKIDIIGTPWSAALAVPTRLPHDAGGLPGSEEKIIRPLSFNDRWFQANIGGTTGGGEPSWDTTLGNTTVDNDITFEAIRARRIDVAIDSITNHMEFVIKGYTGDAPNTFLGAGHIIFTSGNNNGAKRGISSWDLGLLTVKVFQPLTQLIAVDDTLTLVSGCDRLRATCVDDYDNVFNMRAEPDLPGNDKILRTPPPQPSG